MTLDLFKRAVPALAVALILGTVACHRHDSGASSSASDTATLESSVDTPMTALNGYVWEASAPQSKLDFLLGVECSLAMEAALKQVAEERGGTVELSRFANGWQIAFRDKARPDIVRQIDEFYVQNPEQKERHVFDVIWMEMVRPAMTTEKR
ncbi:MAG: hypothetical protein IKJ34_00740 [Mailhella sp.]|nr:hypothetical protein [Mailhella sp.]